MTEDTIETVPMPIGPFFRFPDESTGTAALADAGLLTDDGTVITASHTHAVDCVGVIPDISGWHINYVGKLPAGWDQYVVHPKHPVRVWA